MTRFSLASVLLLTSTLVAAQNKPEIQIVFNPTYSYRFVTGDPESQKILKSFQTPRFRYDVGVLMTVGNRSRLSFETGLLWSRKAFSFGEVLLRDENNNPAGSFTMHLVADFLELPARLRYSLTDVGRSYMVLGLSGDFLVIGRFKIHESELTDPQPVGDPQLRKANAGLQVGFGHRIARTKRFDIDLEPILKVQLFHAFEAKGNATIRFYTAGLNTKIRLKSQE